LSILDEAAVFFSASMEPAEMLRLVAARLEGVLKNSAVEFFLSGEGSELRKIGSRTSNVVRESAGRLSLVKELAVKALVAKQIERGEFEGMHCVAVPLTRGDMTVAAYSISSQDSSLIPNEDTLQMIASRIEPILGGTLSFASTLANALSDNLTNLPNERAFYLILENQVAEAQRFGDLRSLTVLAVDINAFDEINQKFGHSAGDRLLAFAGGLIREQLRKMDFLARTKGDEFLLILPTAESGASENIQTRIAEAFESTPFEIADGIRRQIRLNYGSATFGKDADTSSGLVKAAVENKLRAKSTDRGGVLQFPKREGS
ncbi:MAG: GGDEF domain-containing protein, partial [Acidobacteriota bacterium]|nr:GGDEF domain-containing protein [Acidobacteriota bacterium]